MPLNDNDLLLINDSQDSNEAKKIKYSTLKSNINGDGGNDLQTVTDNGDTTTNGATFGGIVEVKPDSGNANLYINSRSSNEAASRISFLTKNSSGNISGGYIAFDGADSRLYISGNTATSAKHLAIDPSGNVSIGGTMPGSPNIALNTDGSAAFAGDVKAAEFDLSNNTTAKGARIGQFGVTVQRAVTGGSSVDTVFTGYRGATQTSSIGADGAASFDGEVLGTSATTNTFLARADLGSGLTMFRAAHAGVGNSDRFFFYGTDSAGGKAHIATDGSAEFAGEVLGTSATTNTFLARADLESGLTMFRAAHAGVGGSDKFFFYGTDNSGGKAHIATDGSAEFAGDVNIGTSVTSTTIGGIKLLASGGFYTNRTSEASGLYTGRLNGDNVFTVTGNGNLWAKGKITADGSIGFNLEPDNPANYTVTTSTDEEGNEVETRVYNGPTLDVKDRIMNLISRLDAIEANEVIDDATDSSLLQLVASASSRLDSLEARIAALEGGN